MPTSPASTADEIADSIRSLIDRVSDAKVSQEIARRGQGMAGVLGQRGADAGDRASGVWRDTKPLRRDAMKRANRARHDAARWSGRTWRSSLRPTLNDLWTRRTFAIGAAGAAVPAGRELVDTAAVRLGLRQREERRWLTFVVGLLVGAAAGAIAALLTAPKRGSEMRHELSAKADEVRTEISARAKDADWITIFQRADGTNGNRNRAETFADTSSSVPEAAAEGGTATGGAADQAAADTAESINEAFDTVDREPQA